MKSKKVLLKNQIQDWVRMCLREAKRRHGDPGVIILDNVSCHSGIEEILLETEFNDFWIFRLGLYSPMFNPIEQIWSTLKAVSKELWQKKLKKFWEIQ